MLTKVCTFGAAGLCLALVGCTGGGSEGETVVELETFQEPQVVPNTNVAEPQPVAGSEAMLFRDDHSLYVELVTHDLPKGAYTFWWHLTHPDGESSIVWGGGAIVRNDAGELHFSATLAEGTENAPGAIFTGNSLQPGTAQDVEVEFWARTHGPPKDDRFMLGEQLTTPFGVCTDERNPNPRPEEDFPCWNPQRALFGQTASM